MTPSNERLQHIAAMYAKHADELQNLVRRRASGAQPATIDDACSFAWTQLISAEHIDVRPPRWSALAWLTTTAIRKAWEITAAERRAAAHDHDQLDRIADARGLSDAPADERAALQMRCDLALDLVAQIPERPRRFLLRLALGYSYQEIAAAEGVSYRTTDRQITRAKRRLEEIAAADGANFGPAATNTGMDTITLTYHGQTVALAARERFWLAAHIEALPAGHPDKRHVCFMALYARDILTGDLPGPYSDDDAARFAQLALQTGSGCSATHHPRSPRTTRRRAHCAPLNWRQRRPPARG